MDQLKALLLGIVQGLTEFLPVSSSGHIELGKALLNLELKDDLAFSVIVHLATVLSTIIVFRKDISMLLKDVLRFNWNANTQFVSYLSVSMLPIAVVGLAFEEQIAQLFNGKLTLVGVSLLITGLLLLSTTLFKTNTGKLTMGKALLIGIAQAAAIIPGISRSGATIATALNLGISKEQAARFSFLMVLLPIIGASVLQLKELLETPNLQVDASILGLGFLGAFASGVAACTIMLAIVKKGKISYFAYYCFIVGALALIFA